MRSRNARSRSLADLELEAGQIHRRRRDVEARHRGLEHGVAQRRLAGQHVVGRGGAALAVDAEAGRGVALRIEVDDQHVLADRGERGAEIDRGRGLADAALLVGEREDARDCPAPCGIDRLIGRRVGLVEHGLRENPPWFQAFSVG